MEAIWDYYKRAAQELGRKKEEEEAKASPVQAAYSLAWFYASRAPRDLNDLTQAFLGGREARERLRWDEPIPDESMLRSFFLEGKHPPDFSQQRAIQIALANPISFLQGPPGTGKTTMILHLLSCITAMGKTAAVVSSNRTAKENVEEKIHGLSGGVGAPNQQRLKDSLAVLGAAEIRKNFTRGAEGAEHQRAVQAMGVRDSSGALVSAFCHGVQVYPLEDGTEQRVSRERYLSSDVFLKRYPIVTSTLHSLPNCFRDGDICQYDYVILDESSQAGILPGIVAMSRAKHLVLVGDEEQLSAFLSGWDEQRLQSVPAAGVAAPYRLSETRTASRKREDKNFLTLCLELFLGETHSIAKGRDIKVLLNQHYRCHRGIIQFCNEMIYRNQLIVETERTDPGYNQEVRIPIRVRWFEGNYCEDVAVESRGDGNQSRKLLKKQNQKQIAVFMREEWPELARRWRASQKAGQPLSFCVMSPFNHQLAVLEQVIQECQEGLPEEDRVPIYRSEKDERRTPAEEPGDYPIPMLSTIHKAQGQEFDVVYLLPVEDGQWQWPWSQKKRMVNVAVSRAKRELVLVVSAELMSPALWKEFSIRACGERGAGQVDDDSGEMYIQKLTEYVFRETRRTPGVDWSRYPDQGRFGFHPSRLISMFDRLPQIREKLRLGGQTLEKQSRIWATEVCLAETVLNLPLFSQENLRLFQEVRIRDMLTPDVLEQADGGGNGEREQLLAWIQTDTRFDFVICKPSDSGTNENQVLLVIELDGNWHRKRESVQESDHKKNQVVQELFQADCYLNGNCGTVQHTQAPFAFLRLPCDGTTYWETDDLRAAAQGEGGRGLGENRFTIEDLLREQLNRTDRAPCALSLISISVALRQIKEQNGWTALPKGIHTQRVEQELERGGYLVCRKEDWVPIQGWVSTMPGHDGFGTERGAGLQKGFSIEYRKNKESLGCLPVCSLQACEFLQTVVKKLMEETEPPQ